MKIENAKVRCLNLERSHKRWIDIVTLFGDKVIRIDAVDGMQFASGEWDRMGKPCWAELPIDVTTRYFEMYPTTYGCNLSHIKSWEHFLNSDEEWGIFVEDDTMPIKDILSVDIPDDCDFFYLIGPDHPGYRIGLFPDRQVRFARTLGAYLMSRKAAELAIRAMNTHYYQADTQVPIRIFDSMKHHKIKAPNWAELPRIKAYGPTESIVGHSEHAESSTFTIDGKKNWIPDELKSIKYTSHQRRHHDSSYK
jgi:hypothetical protein